MGSEACVLSIRVTCASFKKPRTYVHRKLTFLAKKIKELFKYLHLNLEVKAVSTPTLMASFRSARKIKDYLVIAKLYLLEQNVGSRKFNKEDAKCVIILK